MKKLLFGLVALVTINAASAQDVKKTFGVGFQSSFPIYGLSAKYAVTDQSVIQATIAPFGSGVAKINFYGARYIHRFTNESNENLNPYLFAGGGLITYSGLGTTSSNFFSYSAGGGIEYIVGGAVGLSVDLGYGKLGVTNDVGVSGVFFGAGIHYYIN